MPSDLSEDVQYWTDEAARYAQNVDYWRTRTEAAEAELAALKSTFTENQRERFARYAEEHAKVLGLETERDALRELVMQFYRAIVSSTLPQSSWPSAAWIAITAVEKAGIHRG